MCKLTCVCIECLFEIEESSTHSLCLVATLMQCISKSHALHGGFQSEHDSPQEFALTDKNVGAKANILQSAHEIKNLTARPAGACGRGTVRCNTVMQCP